MIVSINLKVDIDQEAFTWWLFEVQHRQVAAQMLTSVTSEAAKAHVANIEEMYDYHRRTNEQKGVHPHESEAR